MYQILEVCRRSYRQFGGTARKDLVAMLTSTFRLLRVFYFFVFKPKLKNSIKLKTVHGGCKLKDAAFSNYLINSMFTEIILEVTLLNFR